VSAPPVAPLDPRAPTAAPGRARLRAAVLAFLDRCAEDLSLPRERERDALLAELAAFQRAHVAPFARLWAARGASFERGPDGWPALPTDVFRFARVSVFSPGGDVRVFRTSGTTSGARGEHAFVDLALYHRAALLGGAHALLAAGPPEGAPLELVLLALEPARHPDSSLGHMLGLFADARRGADPRARVTWAFDGERIDRDALVAALERAERDARPAALLGTSFAFVFAEELLAEDEPRSARGPKRFALPRGSRAMLTGGFKGRTRELAPDALAARVAARYGLPRSAIVSEYGMTELSSQLWGRGLLDGEGGVGEGERLWIPPWVRVTAVEPSTLAPLPEGTRGLLRIDDLANLDSCVSIQTADLGAIERDALGHPCLVLAGRDPGALPRGCSLAIEEALAG
jgi:hypothetical protein